MARNRLRITRQGTPVCEQCDVEMERYADAPDTGRAGWGCPECGWSEDDLAEAYGLGAAVPTAAEDELERARR